MEVNPLNRISSTVIY